MTYQTGSDLLEKLIDEMLEIAGSDDENQRIFHEMMVTVIKLVTDHAEIADLKLLNSTFKELRYSLKIFKDYRDVPKVSVFGSARTKPNDPGYIQAKLFSSEIAKKGWMVINGAGPGIMQAAAEGAGRDKAFGVNIRLPFEQKANPIMEADKKLINFKYFFTRKLFFLREAKAIVLLPGGFGTLDEGYESLTLVQTGKANPIPIVLLEGEGSNFWSEWEEFFYKNMIPRNLISREDVNLFLRTSKVQEAVNEVINFYKNYHSLRYVNGWVVLRLKKVTDDMLKIANSEFKVMLESGRFEETEALPEEYNEPELIELPRIKFRFNQTSFSVLRLLINMLNAEY